MASEESTSGPGSDRRGFLVKWAAAVLGAVAGVGPVISGVVAALDPLRRRGQNSGAVFVTALSALPSDGIPRKFNIVADRKDAWNTYRRVPVGAVYLRRTGPEVVKALNVVCPHLGCFVSYTAAKGGFDCPCHNSSFTVDGAIDNPDSPSPRALDALEVEIRGGTEVWVRFRNFRPGLEEQVPIA